MTIQDRIIENTKKELTDILMIMYNCGDTNNCLLDIQKILIQSIKEIEEETRKEKDIAEKFLYSNLPLDLSIGTEFEVGGRYEDWGFIVMYKGNKISEGGTLEEAINNAKSKLYITNKDKQ